MKEDYDDGFIKWMEFDNKYLNLLIYMGIYRWWS